MWICVLKIDAFGWGVTQLFIPRRLDKHRQCVGYFVATRCGWMFGYYMRQITELRETIHGQKRFGFNCTVKEYKKKCIKAGYFKCGDKCINNRKVCDGVSNCPNNEDEDPALCEVRIQTSMTNPTKDRYEKTGTKRDWSIFCVARYEDTIGWFKKRPDRGNRTSKRGKKGKRKNKWINISRRVRKCPEHDSCRYSIKQTLWPGEEALYVSELHIKSLKTSDFGTYRCNTRKAFSRNFKLKLERGRCQMLLKCNRRMRSEPTWTEKFPINPQAEINCRHLDVYLKCRERRLKKCIIVWDKRKSMERRTFYQYFCSDDVMSDLKLGSCFNSSSLYTEMLMELKSCEPIPGPKMEEPFACSGVSVTVSPHCQEQRHQCPKRPVHLKATFNYMQGAAGKIAQFQVFLLAGYQSHNRVLQNLVSALNTVEGDDNPPPVVSTPKGHVNPPPVISPARGHINPPLVISTPKGHINPPLVISTPKGHVNPPPVISTARGQINPPLVISTPKGHVNPPPVVSTARGHINPPPVISTAVGHINPPPVISTARGYVNPPPAISTPKEHVNPPPAISATVGNVNPPPSSLRTPRGHVNPSPAKFTMLTTKSGARILHGTLIMTNTSRKAAE
ncbi:protein transport protein Sec24C-like isoform X4 [Elysia marginata]|uniref:Protein transport protein Sec24C-like isoform X4 n=1 Tax=Elysia marginata TaxID=1093978 RepID=A0AAV4ES21_9GAST|nr:protein transport protein Sec24C-like isoform X4 [Elysia marginata]